MSTATESPTDPTTTAVVSATDLTGINAAAPTSPRAIDRIRAVYAAKSWHIDVPEWPVDAVGTPMRICFLPLTQQDLEIAQIGLSDEQKANALDRHLRLFVHKARDAQGRRLFEPGDLEYLRTEAHWPVINRVTNFMYACGSMTIREAKTEITDPNGDGSAAT